MKKKPPRRKQPHDISAAWYVVPMAIAAAVLIARGDQRMDVQVLPAAASAMQPASPAAEADHPGAAVWTGALTGR